MSADDPRPLGPSNFMEAPDTRTWGSRDIKEGGVREEEERGSLSPQKGATDESDESDGSELEPPAVIRRKVSFADAFGLDLVYVKEFDSTDLTGAEVADPPESQVKVKEPDEYFLSYLFTVPSSPEELEQRLQDQKLELESIELLPGTTTLRGIVRVVNFCYNKSLYIRITLDSWKTSFDLLAEYVPGSSDGTTDRFAFRLTLVPPFEMEGARVEFCLRYETSVGTFWANNGDMNYVLFCHKKGGRDLIAMEPQLEEVNNRREKRSCLKVNSKMNSAEENPVETTTDAADSATHRAEGTDRKTVDNAKHLHSILHHEDYHHKHLGDSQRSRRRVARSAQVQEYFSQQEQAARQEHISNELPHNGLEKPPSLPDIRIKPLGDSASSLLRLRQKKQANDTPQIMTYHQIPLLSLYWGKDKVRAVTPDEDDIWIRTRTTPQVTSDKSEDNLEEQTSVCDLWEAFLNGTDSKDTTSVPESEWLQSATSVCPSIDKEDFEASSKVENQQEDDLDSNTQRYTHCTVDELPSWAHNHVMPVVSAEEPLPRSGVTFPKDDKALVYDPLQRSEAIPVTDTLQESIPSGAARVAGGSVDSTAQCYKHVEGGRGRGEEPFTPYRAEPVTSSGETETTDMTAMAESQNAIAADRICQGERQDKTLSSDMEVEVKGNVHKAADDTVTFRETVRERTEDKTNTQSHGVEEGFAQTNKEDELFRQNQTEEEEFTQDLTEEVLHRQCQAVEDEFRINRRDKMYLELNLTEFEEFRPSRTYEDELRLNQTEKEETSLKQSEAEEFRLKQTHEEEIRPNKSDKVEIRPFNTVEDELKPNQSEAEKLRSNQEDEEESRPNQTFDDEFNWNQTEVEELRPNKIEMEEEFSPSHQDEEDDRRSHTDKELRLNHKDEELDRENRTFAEKFRPNQTPNEEFRSNELEELRLSQFDEEQRDRENLEEVEEFRSKQTHEERIWSNKIQEEDVYQSLNKDSSTHNLTEPKVFREKNTGEVENTENVMAEMSRQRDTEQINEDRSIETPEKQEVDYLTDETANTRNESEDVSTEKEEEHEVTMENMECPRQDENGRLSEGSKELIIKDDKESFEKEVELGEDEIFTEQKGLNEEMLEEVENSPLAEQDNEKEEIEEKLSDVPEVVQNVPIHQTKRLTKKMVTDIDSWVDSLMMARTVPDLTFTLRQGLSQTTPSSNAEPSMGQAYVSSPNRGTTVLSHSSPLSTRFNTVVSEGSESMVSQWLTQNPSSLEEDQETISSRLSPPPSEKVEDAASSVLAWLRVFFSLSSVTRALVYALLVAVFLFTTLMYNFPACFALYLFSLYW
ncbi:uncharacterized protein LOC121546258 isoform X1 [Coregonus clupeaformis]|uniref:uncharacterized protein LOC121546258 isoform X1 n=1 Tax=Coregonus clupeaformis TaxID=59861 RepID=UPI001BDFCBFF|nr:uncharacterized protein LOC121546258 isoform X1 [Coregonus clupeaformis]XP_041713354.1 uncharacterized protein LOC121546258 isoform X1 [Coregonus clupeaformis]